MYFRRLYTVVHLPLEQYHLLSEKYLIRLADSLDELGKDVKDFDCDYSSGILNFNVGEKRYVLNKQPVNKQIWWSSPLSGPLRFDFDGNLWFNKHNQLLSQLIHREWNTLTNRKDELSKFTEI